MVHGQTPREQLVLSLAEDLMTRQVCSKQNNGSCHLQLAGLEGPSWTVRSAT
jgi:hypothetical protein